VRTTEPVENNKKPKAGLDADLALLRNAVRNAGALALEFFGKNPASRRKPDGTEVSEADLAVDNSLREALLGSRPGYGWLSEETEDDTSRLNRERVWVVDPIDGTRAFLREKPEWTISAGLVERGKPVIGIVYNPATAEFFEASRGGGARLDGRSICVSDPVPLTECCLVSSQKLFQRDIWDVKWPPVETRWVNSIAYRLALVAAGKCDGTLSLSPKNDWDLAAAHLLVQEAGGRITTHSGDSIRYNGASTRQRSVIAAGVSLHTEILHRTATARI
jgi:myo-inositol-1(or 4)-monophosphatase